MYKFFFYAGYIPHISLGKYARYYYFNLDLNAQIRSKSCQTPKMQNITHPRKYPKFLIHRGRPITGDTSCVEYCEYTIE